MDDDSKRLGNMSASIDHAIINRDSTLTTVSSGATNLPEYILEQPQEERDKSASKLLVQKDETLKGAYPELSKAVHNILENPDSSEQVQKGNVTIIMHSNIYGSAFSGDVQQANLTFNQEWNQIKNEIDFDQLRSEVKEAIEKMQMKDVEAQHLTDLSNIVLARDQLDKADGPSMLKYLRKTGEFGLDIIKGIGADLLLMLIKGG